MPFRIKILVVLGCLFPLVPITLFLLFYQMPKSYEPYILNLCGTWQVQTNIPASWNGETLPDKGWKEVKLPGRLDQQGIRSEYTIFEKKIVLKEKMANEDLFLMICGTGYSVGKVYINNHFINEIGLFKANKKIGSMIGIEGFFVEKGIFIPGENTIILYFRHNYSFIAGIFDSRFYMGVNEYLRPYYNQNLFLSNFFSYGVIFFSFFMLIILLILIATEWKSPGLYKYISAALLILSSLLYNLFASGAFVNQFMQADLLLVLVFSFAIFILATMMEFIQYYLTQKINLLRKINRWICIAFMVSFFAVFLIQKDDQFLAVLYFFMHLYIFTLIFYILFIMIKFLFRKTISPYSLVVIFSLFIGICTAINDALVDLGIIHTSPVFTITISTFSIIGTIVVIAEFIGISVTNRTLAATLQKANEEVNQLNANLEKKVTERTRALEKAKNEIEAASEQKTNFFINLAHETKTPLTVIGNSMDEYIKKMGLSRELEEIQYNIGHLLRNMAHFLDAEKLQRGQVFYDHEEIFCLSDFLTKKCALFEASVRKKKLTLSSVILPSLYIQADSFAVDRLMNNLLDNAVKYNREGGSIHVSLKKSGENLILEVKDSGIGITKENLKAIFNPYHQISRKKRNIQGIGMGLFIVSGILKSLGGKIDVESREGEGSSFTLTLPAASKGRKAGTEDAPVSVPLLGPDYEEIKNPEKIELFKDTLLIVEDNISLLRQLRERFEPLYNVFCAKDGLEALDILEKQARPDLVISDIMMDGMDGYELLEKIQEKEDLKEIPFLFLTAKTAVSENIQGLSSGAIDYIYKPFPLDVLSAKVEALIHYRKLKKALFESDKAASLGRLSAGITHEILNPLSGIKGPIDYLHGVYQKDEKAHNPTMDEAFFHVYNNIGRIERIVKDLRVLIYNKPLFKEKVKLKEVVESIVRLAGQKVTGRVEFALEIPDGFMIETNVMAFTHILMNLIHNAVDSIPEKGKVTISAAGEGGRYSIAVSDTGKGIEAKYLSRIFDIDFTTKVFGKGSGFGLYFVRELSSRLGLTLKIESEAGKGSTFMVHS